MKHKIGIAVCSIFILCLCVVSKWQLALEEGEAGAQQGHLIGVFVTTDHLDLFDIDSYLADNAGSLWNANDEVEVWGNTEKYERRLYATLKPAVQGEEETFDTKEYVFEGVQGIPFFYFDESLADEPGDYAIPINDEAISDVNFNINNGEDEDSIMLEGTMYVSPSNEETIYHLNPVYQSRDGSVYTVEGSSMSSDSYSVGFEQSMSLEEVTEITENGKSKKESILVKFNISVMPASEKIVIIQMDVENISLARTEYEPGKLPESFAAQAEAAYLVVETYRHGEDGELEISREICNRDADEIVTFFGREDGVCVEKCTPIEW
ncbi:MAG: hypothetical protein ACRC3H_03760 [Lachnospiraceae bacterium]